PRRRLGDQGQGGFKSQPSWLQLTDLKSLIVPSSQASIMPRKFLTIPIGIWTISAMPSIGAQSERVAAYLFPVFLKLAGRAVLLVGGGAVAAARLPELLRADACVTVVAPDVRAEILASTAAVHVRAFDPSDVDGAWLVVAAASPEINREVAAAAEE